MSRPALFTALCLVGLWTMASSVSGETTGGASGLKVVSRIAGLDGGWDYASFDPASGRVFVAHGDAVMAIDVRTGKANPHFTVGDHLHAVVPVPGTNLIVTTNSGDSTARIIDARDGKFIASVPTAKGPDGAIYDPSTHLILVIDGDSGEITLVDPRTRKSPGSITVGGSLESPAVDGQGKLFVNVASRNEIAVIDIADRKVVGKYPLSDCRSPTGLAFVTGGRLVAACRGGSANILDAATGKVVASFKIGGFPDAVLFDPYRRLAFIPSWLSGTLTVIALSGPHDNTIIDTVATQIGARTGAVDPKTGRIYLPAAHYDLPVPAGERPKAKPGTFEVLVLDRQ